MEEGINHSELVNMVSEGVKQAIEYAGPPSQAESMNNAQHDNALQEQINEMKAMMAQLSSENQALQAAKIQQHNQQLLRNISNQQQPPYPIPTSYYGPPVYNPNYHGYNYHQQGNRNSGQGCFQTGGRGYGNHRNQRRFYNNGHQQNQRSQYCWTHGSCGHNSSNCQTPSEGHQRNASYNNRMGGNNRNCRN